MNLAYVAGLLDGEGCINFTKCRDLKIPRVSITNTNLDILEDLKKQFGGHIQKATRVDASWKPAFHWVISNSACARFLEQIEKWVRIKQEQVWLVLAWDAIRPGTGHLWSNEAKEALELINAQSKWLNWKGVGRPEISPIDQELVLARGK